MEDNIKVGKSEGTTCFKCETAIKPGEKVIRFSFNVNLIITTKKIQEEAHLPCAEEFHSLLGRRIGEAFRK